MKIEDVYDKYYEKTQNPLAAALLVIARILERNQNTMDDDQDED
jgi:hypothetical protein